MSAQLSGVLEALRVLQLADEPCREPSCDGETHYTGERDRETNEDVESGPCPVAAHEVIIVKRAKRELLRSVIA